MMTMMKLLLRVFCVLGLATAAIPAGAADDGYTSPPDADHQVLREEFLERRPDIYDDGILPDRRLTSAYNEFTGRYLPADAVEAANRLRRFALLAHPDKVRENLAYAERTRMDADFLEIFRQAIAWGDHIWQSDGKYVWEQHIKEKSYGGHFYHSSTAIVLSTISMVKGYKYASFRLIMDDELNFASARFNPWSGLSGLSGMAWDGYELAVQELIERHLTGDVLPKHAGAAYLWLRRGEHHGFDMSSWRARVERVAGEEDRAWAKAFLDKNYYPKNREYGAPLPPAYLEYQARCRASQARCR